MTPRKDTFRKILHDLKNILIEEKLKSSFLFTNFSSPTEIVPKAPVKVTPRAVFMPKEEKPTLTPLVEKPVPIVEEEKKVAPSQPLSLPIDGLRKVVEKSCPYIRLNPTIPGDEEATLRKNAWKRREHEAEVLLFFFGASASEKLLLQNIAKAISTVHRNTHMLDAMETEKDRSWKTILEIPQLKIVFAPPLETWKTPILKSLVIENPATKEFHLGKARLFFFPPLEKALNDPLNKRKLWQWIEQRIASPA